VHPSTGVAQACRKTVIRFVPSATLRDCGNSHTSGIHDVAIEAPDNWDRGWFVVSAAHHEPGVYRDALWSVFVLDLA